MSSKMDKNIEEARGMVAASEAIPSLKSLMQLKKKYDAPDVGSLPEGYKKNSDKERLYLWSADNFRRQIQHKYPTLKPLCLTSKNECGTEKLAMTFIRPTILPYSHLFNLDECAKFISDFLFYEPKEFKGMLWSPTYVLATQIGNSLEISNILASFLIGFGFRAYVVCGYVEEAVSRMNRTQEKCPYLMTQAASIAADTSHLSTKYTPKKPPELKSKYVQFLHKLKQDAVAGKKAMSTFLGQPSIHLDGNDVDLEAMMEPEDPAKDYFFHAWVYVDISDSTGFFIEATTGERRPLDHESYKSINSLWNHENYWLSNDTAEDWKNEKSLELSNSTKWIKFVCDLDLQAKKESSDDSPKRLLNNLHGWLMELVIPRDCFELMYRLGQKTSEFKNVNVEFFAPYLLKDGMVQRVTQVKDENEKEEEDTDKDGSEDYEEDELTSFEDHGEDDPEGEDTEDYEEEESEFEEEGKNTSDSEADSESKKQMIQPPTVEPPTPVPSAPIADDKPIFKRPPQVIHVLERFRHRSDKMTVRETFPTMDKVVERFANGRKDRLMEHEFFKVGAAILGGEAEDVSRYYSASRLDGLTRRVWKGMELIEEYVGRPDRLIHMHVQFVQVEKKFGPAGDRSAREIGKIVETYEMHARKTLAKADGDDGESQDSGHADDEEDGYDYDDTFSPGRILDTRYGIMERTYDIDGRRILLKFHREKGQIFCRSVEFYEPQDRRPSLTTAPGQSANVAAAAAATAAPGSARGSAGRNSLAVAGSGAETGGGGVIDVKKEPELTSEDVKVYLVDPRDEKPCLRELSDIYKEHVEFQKSAIKRVAVIEKEMDVLLESRMKELSANDMEVWVFDTKRNAHVQKGRLEQEQLARKKEESILDLELDFLAPYFQRYPDVTSLTRAQAMEIRDECLNNIRVNLEDKERILSDQIEGIKEEMKLKRNIMSVEEIRSRKFMCNVLETRLARQKRETIRINAQAEKKIKNDSRLVNILGTST